MKFRLTVLLLLFITSKVWAVPIGYTDLADFSSAAGTTTTLDFDDLTLFDTINTAETVDGITFSYDFGGVLLDVENEFLTTSGSQYLGTDDGGVLQDGDNFSLSFAPVNAIGMYFITADEMYFDDIVLNLDSSAFIAFLDPSEGLDLGDGGYAYFIGIVDVANTFTSVDVITAGGGNFVYNVDDIITGVISGDPPTGVPEPGTLALMLAGLFFLRYQRPIRRARPIH